MTDLLYSDTEEALRSSVRSLLADRLTAQDVLDLPLLRLPEQPGAGLLGRLLQLLDPALHLLDLQLLLAKLQLMFFRRSLACLSGDLLSLAIESTRQLEIERLLFLI